MNKDHLKIHKQPSLNIGKFTLYLVNTYYDYAQTFYFETRKEAKEFVAYSKQKDQLFQ
tara:strand:+ start:262 stop:435 length:174 start_codon:yes stop_codon:yes gene_type:complete